MLWIKLQKWGWSLGGLVDDDDDDADDDDDDGYMGYMWLYELCSHFLAE